MPQKAIVCYQRAIQAQPDYAMAFAHLADVYYEQGNLEMTIRNYRRAIARDAEFFPENYNLINALKEAGKVQEAIDCCHNFQKLLFVLSRNMMSTAAQCFKASLSVTTDFSSPFRYLTVIYMQQRCYAQAISCYNEVLRIDPVDTDALVERGNAYIEIDRVDEAMQDYTRAIAISPTMAEAHMFLANAYIMSDDVESAIKSYRQALMICPDFPKATCNLFHALQSVCDWDNREEMFIEVEGILRREVEMSFIPRVEPLQALAYPLDPMLSQYISLKYAEYFSVIAARYSLSLFTHPPPLPIKGGDRKDRLRVGYVSSDFRDHSLSHLMGSVFWMHDRRNVEVFCYALCPNDGSEFRICIQSEAEHFIDVSSLTFDATARRINEDRMQVLVDLNGYTKPAPIQVSYLGFPGTMGAPYIHYLITDEFVSPLKYTHFYSEKLVHLPHCYFVHDYKQKNRDVLYPYCQPKRSDYGLPEDKFLFACFNHLSKMDPEIFMTCVYQIVRFGFSDFHLQRRRGSAHNAHTTGTDVLWAGLPMVTLPLEKMATRVAGSLCLATGLGDDMIVSSMKEYEEKAVSLALNRPKLQHLTNRLKAVRMSCPLFNTARWARNLERAYFKMWNLHCSGQHPQHFKVTENDSEFPFDR
ncbi:putative UDP-N-acetylglucosamine--peptide N-acetylglucosaminyltransferase SEC [Capsicum annuum]|uniref:protein O-GlcNAc transferase n=1 Tax=Capsicum annuum TaxID=4072 RepID=A0A2G2ZTD8_CAPAN|nr:putative UDP-N-acetylglucosamine--peptide N-acetylglucosaminyltransferase SEC [Capsicum annuum]PHT85232.1 putative UDP-N-acetylglucosamine--peptide N-acetylglucosaminyltransferase SEC [Capsicum annuum]